MNPLPSPDSPEGLSRPPAASQTSFEDELRAPGSSESDASSVTSNVTTVSAAQTNAITGSNANNNAPGGDTRPPRPPRTSSMAISNANTGHGSSSTVNLVTERPTAAMPQNEPASRKSTLGRERSEIQRHRSRHHSQGFFEPSLPTASYSDAGLSTSRIAAQAAMQSQQHHQQPTQVPPKRPPTILQEPEDGSAMGNRGAAGNNTSPPPPLPPPLSSAPNLGPPPGQQAYQNGLWGGNAATTAANVVFPRNPSPGMPAEPTPEREPKQKSEKSKKKLFSKPKHIGISRDKDAWKDRGQPSPSKMSFAGGGLSRIVSASTTTLPDAPQISAHNNPSLYNLSNTSSTTVVPADKPAGSEKEKEKEKDKEKDKDKAHKHHFLRQKMRLKDRGGDDHRNLPLSSASSNSKPSDPSAPQSLYSFIPASPGTVTTTFGKSVSGLDILHGGRALREKKKEEKALAESEQVDGLGNQATSAGTPAVFPGPSSLGSSTGLLAESALRETLQGFGLNNMTPEDAWDFLKAKLLVIFDGEDVRIAIEDLNKLVLIHIQRCVQKRTPTAIIDDLRELLETGFASLNHNLTGVPDEKLVPHLVQIWMLTFGTILPFIQAVFLPLDLEFKGCGSVMSLREANEFWSTTPERGMSDGRPMGGTLEVRNLVLTAFRDMIIICRYDTLLSTFSRLSLDSINLGNSGLSMTTTKSSSNSGRPGTAASLDGGGYGSYSSQSSMLLTAAGSYSSDSVSLDNRSRAASNTSSNPDQLIFQSFSSPAPQRPSIINRTTTDTSHLITETVGRMLQCVSVLASVQTSDDAQERIEVLNKALKHNWLGRGRTGRDRRGFVGAKIRPTAAARSTSDDSTKVARNGDWELGIMQDRRREMGVL